MTSILLTRRMRAGSAEGAALWVSTADMASTPESGLPPRTGRGHCRSDRRLRRLVASLGALRPAGVALDVFGRGLLEQRLDLLLQRLDPVGRLDPLGPVPLLHVGRRVTVVVVAGHLHRRAEVREAELLPARRRDVERLEAAPHV